VYAPERHRAIMERLAASGRCSVVDLASHLGVAVETIRRDLSHLERQGLLRRVHGGVIPLPKTILERTVLTRSGEMVDAKQAIARAALDEVPEQGSLIIDAGTSTGQLVALLPSDRELTVVTNFLPHAVALADNPRISVLLLGGRVRAKTLACVDDWAEQSLAQIVADVAFIGTDGISETRGLTTPDRAEAAIKRAMIKSARRVVVLADHRKFGQEHFAQFGTLDDVDVVITDSAVDPEIRASVEALGPVVVSA
jgi:DeoR family fructose operon transcriptional repressor